MTVAIRPAAPGPAVHELVHAAGLPTGGLDGAWRTWLAEDDGWPVGTVSLERHGDALLLRGLAVARGHRGTGLGARLVAAALDAAEPVGPVALLTETAAGYFPRFGFTQVRRDDLHPALAASPELRGLCPASATAMVRR